MRLLAEIATRNRIFDEAEFLLESCVAFHPKHRNARIQHANILLRMQKFGQAWELAASLLRDHPDDVGSIRPLYATACSGVGKNQEAIKSYELLMQRHPKNHLYPVSLAHVHKSEGDIDRAVALYRQAYQIKRGPWRRLLELGQHQVPRLHRGGNGANGGGGVRPRHQRDRPDSTLLRPRHRLGGPGRNTNAPSATTAAATR